MLLEVFMPHSFGKLMLFPSLLLSASVFAESLQLTSKDIVHGEFMGKAQEFTGFGCSGGNTSPQLSWSGAPEGTEAYALFAYDPDAPTGSGWWHWQVINISKDTTSLAAGAGDLSHHLMPKDVVNISNDYGFKGFGGACPPEGHGVHRYQFTLYALSKRLALPKGASAALAGYMVNAHSLASSTIEALYER